MSDPLSEVVKFLQPQALLANLISGRGNWAIRYSEFGLPSFCIMLEGSCLLAIEGQEPTTITAGDFILLPTTPSFTISSFTQTTPVCFDPNTVAGRKEELRYGEQEGPADMRSLGGSFQFNCTNPDLLVSMLPRVIHVRGSERLSQLVQLVADESIYEHPGSEYILSRLAEMLLIESMRSTTTGTAPPGLLRGLGDERLAQALKAFHNDIAYPWTIIKLAKIAALSRSAFFERFSKTIGITPMDYIVNWRMELAKELLQKDKAISEIAVLVGYGSSSAFSVAFKKRFGQSPSRFADEPRKDY
ncbi:AraC family transcriptional regulator [Aliidiomarina shirensis]|uniref:AraC family transcriptional regulator n=1 Tax=Aliidiomarina shirensis TaxID=1048642 RepID=A0A432WVK9_9GAMM|nr:AraC family transcriptional regulator [Aliidiomarina shirensis]RUO37801.1 AraC family transcriptional regulator [Aliidiomarina shirensis]